MLIVTLRTGLPAFGDRIARLRVERGWTQQQLADRLAMSRTALSHLEAGMRVASERTVVILAGVFATPPYELVADTSYPQAKSDRLPEIVALHTEVDMALAMCAAEVELAARCGDLTVLDERSHYWARRLQDLASRWPDSTDRRRLLATRSRVLDELARSIVP